MTDGEIAIETLGKILNIVRAWFPSDVNLTEHEAMVLITELVDVWPLSQEAPDYQAPDISSLASRGNT